MHFFPFEKKERKSISGFNTCGSRSIPAPAPLFLCHAFFLHFSFHLWQMVNRNNSVWLLGGQGAAGGENTAADESAWAGITQGVCDVNLSEERHGQKSRGSAASVANTLLTYGSKGGRKKIIVEMLELWGGPRIYFTARTKTAWIWKRRGEERGAASVNLLLCLCWGHSSVEDDPVRTSKGRQEDVERQHWVCYEYQSKYYKAKDVYSYLTQWNPFIHVTRSLNNNDEQLFSTR